MVIALELCSLPISGCTQFPTSTVWGVCKCGDYKLLYFTTCMYVSCRGIIRRSFKLLCYTKISPHSSYWQNLVTQNAAIAVFYGMTDMKTLAIKLLQCNVHSVTISNTCTTNLHVVQIVISRMKIPKSAASMRNQVSKKSDNNRTAWYTDVQCSAFLYPNSLWCAHALGHQRELGIQKRT